MGLYYPPRAQEMDSSGDPIGSAELFFYTVGTTTLKTVYKDIPLTVAHTNPVVADSSGRFDNIYLNGAYKIKLATTSGTEIWTEDDISVGSSGDFFGVTDDITSTTAINATHEKKHLRCINTINLNLLATSSAGEGFMFSGRNDGTGLVTIDGNSSEQTNDAVTWVIPPGGSWIIICDGSEWSLIGTMGIVQSLAAGDIFYTDANKQLVRLGAGAVHSYLNMGTATVPAWESIAVNAIGSIGGGTQDINLNSGRSVSGTVDTSTTTFTFSNPKTTAFEDMFTLSLTNGGSQTVNWPSSVDWQNGTAPGLTTSGVDELVFKTIDAGTIWVGAFLLDVK